MKSVLLVVIDALASRVVRPAMEAGQLPVLKAIAEAGSVHWGSTAIFPSITPAATAALATGCYPSETGIAGAYYYDQANDHVHYYGDDTWAIIRRGMGEFFNDFLVRMNRDHLRRDTLFQLIERAGSPTACLNFLWFRGNVTHQLKAPWLLRLWPTLWKPREIQGPAMLSLGDFASGEIGGTGQKLKGPGGLFRRFGFSDASTREQLLLLARQRELPRFTLAYFPDNDFESHKQGPEEALASVARVDEALGEFLAEYGGLQQFLKAHAILITGDHSQCEMPHDAETSGIRLDELLANYTIVPAGGDWQHDEELMICPNMRAAQIYIRKGYLQLIDQIGERLLADKRVDQIFLHTDRGFEVRTSHGELCFQPGECAGERGEDEYGNHWTWEGNLDVIDARREDGRLQYGKYPNAFERIATAFDSEVSGDLWVTCHPGYEFRLADTTIHQGGSHGSLHADDSLSPLISAGLTAELPPGITPRSVDVAPLCLANLGISSPHEMGRGHCRGAGKTSQATSK